MPNINDLAPINPNTGEREKAHRYVRIRTCGQGTSQYNYRTMVPVESLYQRGVIWESGS